MAEQLSYCDRLNIPSITIGKAKNLIKNEITRSLYLLENPEKAKKRVEKQTFRLIGPAGIGKTQICKQICDELEEETGKYFELLVIKAPVLNRDDFLIPFPVVGDDGQYKKFEMLYSDFVPDENRPYGLFVIDELSRGDHNLQQLMWQVENENMIHLRNFPTGWFTVCLDNPDESEYSMDMIEDAAGLRRKSQIYVHHAATEFIKYAQESSFYPDVVSYFRTYPDRIYDTKAQKNKMVYTNPASIEKFSDHCWKYDPDGLGNGIHENFDSLTTIAESLFNRNAAEQLMEFIRDSSKSIRPEDVVYYYHTNEIHSKVKSYINEANPRLPDLVVMFATYLITNRPNLGDQEKQNIVDFLTEIPIDTAAIFLNELAGYDNNSDEFAYFTRLHMELDYNYKKYHDDFYVKLSKTSKLKDSEDE